MPDLCLAAAAKEPTRASIANRSNIVENRRYAADEPCVNPDKYAGRRIVLDSRVHHKQLGARGSAAVPNAASRPRSKSKDHTVLNEDSGGRTDVHPHET